VRQDPNAGRHQPAQWQIPRQRVSAEESGVASPGDGWPAARWQLFTQPASDLTNPANQWAARQPAHAQPADDSAVPAADASLGQRAPSVSLMKAISLALAVAAALVFLVSLADRQLTAATAIATVILMLAAVANYGRLVRKRDLRLGRHPRWPLRNGQFPGGPSDPRHQHREVGGGVQGPQGGGRHRGPASCLRPVGRRQPHRPPGCRVAPPAIGGAGPLPAPADPSRLKGHE